MSKKVEKNAIIEIIVDGEQKFKGEAESFSMLIERANDPKYNTFMALGGSQRDVGEHILKFAVSFKEKYNPSLMRMAAISEMVDQIFRSNEAYRMEVEDA